jgi:hypothetical protein
MTSRIVVTAFDGEKVTYEVYDVIQKENSSETLEKFDGKYKAPIEQFNEFRKERPNDIILGIEVIDNYKKESNIKIKSFNGKVLIYEKYDVYFVHNLN